MKVKIISSAISDKKVEKKVNEFLDYLSRNSFEIIEIKYTPTLFYCSAMIIYNELQND